MKIFRKKIVCFHSLDEMPIYNWFKIQELHDLSYILIARRTLLEYEEAIVKEVLSKLTNEFMDTYGLSDEYRKIMRLMMDIRALELDLFISQDRSLLTFIEVKKKELQITQQKKNSIDHSEVIVHVKKYMGGNLDLKKTSVKEFYSILNVMKKESKEKRRL